MEFHNNLTNNTMTTPVTSDPIWLAIVNGCIVGFVLLAGLFVNTAMFLLFMIKSHLRTPTNLLLLNLCTSNLIGCFLVLTSMLKNITTKSTYEGAYCDATATFSQLWWISNIYTLMFLSYDQYKCISTPLVYYQVITHTKIYTFIAFTWILSAVLSFVPVFSAPRYVFRIEQHTCGIDWTKSLIFNIIFTKIAFVVPCIVMIYCYVCIVKDAEKSFRVRPKKTSQSNGEKNKSMRLERKPSILSRINFKQNQIRRESLYGTVKTSFIYFGTFLLAWTPQFTLILLHTFNIDVDVRLEKLVHSVKYLPIFIYPYAFGFRNSMLRKQFKKLTHHFQMSRDVRKIYPTDNIDEKDYEVNVSRRNSRTSISEYKIESSSISFKDVIYDQFRGVSRQQSLPADIANISRRQSNESGLTNVYI